jgi:hypothetical protein
MRRFSPASQRGLIPVSTEGTTKVETDASGGPSTTGKDVGNDSATDTARRASRPFRDRQDRRLTEIRSGRMTGSRPFGAFDYYHVCGKTSEEFCSMLSQTRGTLGDPGADRSTE